MHYCDVLFFLRIAVILTKLHIKHATTVIYLRFANYKQHAFMTGSGTDLKPLTYRLRFSAIVSIECPLSMFFSQFVTIIPS